MMPIEGTYAIVNQCDYKHIEDLLYYDGPLLSLFEDDAQSKYLYLWIDCNDVFNRWCIIPIDEITYNMLRDQQMTLYNVIVNAKWLILFNVNHDGKATDGIKIDAVDMPEQYMPSKDSYLAL